METSPNSQIFCAPGRAKTVIMFTTGGNSNGIVSEIVVKAVASVGLNRLSFHGPVSFESNTQHHIESLILSVSDRITDSLDIPRLNFEVSAKNIGAAASFDIGVEISGFSADLPLILAMISASLQLPLRQDVVCTGHIASSDGHIAAVGSIPEKLTAAISTPEISAFVLPDLEADRSLQVMTPNQYKDTIESLLKHKGDIKIYAAAGLHDALNTVLTDDSIVLGSLRSGFFYANPAFSIPGSPVDESIQILTDDNATKFWNALRTSLLARDLVKARKMLEQYTEFHIKNGLYPEHFGKQLLRLVISLPPAIKRLDDIFPLFSMESFIQLGQCVNKIDHEDFKHLHRANFGNGFDVAPTRVDKTEKALPTEDGEEGNLLGWLLDEISEEKLVQKIFLPIDQGRASYIMDRVTVKEGFEFNESIAAFYAHMFQHKGSLTGEINKDAVAAEAIDVVEKAFERKGGFEAALAEGKSGINGGLRLVFDTMTEHLKEEQKYKFINKTFKDVIEPLDWDSKVRLMEAFLEHFGPNLPPDLRDLPAEKLASNWELLIKYYVELKDKVIDLIKRF